MEKLPDKMEGEVRKDLYPIHVVDGFFQISKSKFYHYRGRGILVNHDHKVKTQRLRQGSFFSQWNNK